MTRSRLSGAAIKHVVSLPTRGFICRSCLQQIRQLRTSTPLGSPAQQSSPFSASSSLSVSSSCSSFPWTARRRRQTQSELKAARVSNDRKFSTSFAAYERDEQPSRPANNEIIPLRKQLKEEAKLKKNTGGGGKKKGARNDDKSKDWELTVGIEIHAQLNTEHKLFSKAATSINDSPNTHVALFDAAFPGTQPDFQKETLIPALRAAVALDCEVQRTSRFDRKHYFYQDQPNGYQITQYYEPFAKNGFLVLHDYDDIDPADGKKVEIGIKQIQMEQDTARTILQPPSTHLLDFNRVSHPLIEIITLPHIHHPATAAACVRKLQGILKRVGAVTTGMEMGGLRADVNVSVRPRDRSKHFSQGQAYSGVDGLGQRTEIKNLSSFKAIEDAIIAERDRQISVLEAGGVIEGETRGWSLGSTETRKLRGKEGEIDYRYMPDPDLGPVIIDESLVHYIKAGLPQTPDEDLRHLVADHRLSVKDAKTLIMIDDGTRLDYYEDVAEKVHIVTGQTDSEQIYKWAANWTLHELGGLLTVAEKTWDENPVSSDKLADILIHLYHSKITGATAKQLLAKVFRGDIRSIEEIIEEEDLLLRPMARDEYLALAQELLAENEAMVEQIQSKGQVGKVKWFVGQMMRRGEKGRVEAVKAEGILRELLGLDGTRDEI
ncbi:hypothetical protein L228DRAFT_259890 [Xylona heveae TC161]|uniref:Glutamyl-tRNA(Gln) amidotransferase subunit B, mitochondrial n=1 Tax=Xylona heveae (strain CBS 132557 / TC161) TaxID=1328760 RepID=A0A165ICQ6_XYLHT|nr:hypothetical protein L228DRAFT_259890 [Xylona heveae TC161]KZF24712.1 hypothetical protein L228DRAFT_259890 [Xylona heveae TC161]